MIEIECRYIMCFCVDLEGALKTVATVKKNWKKLLFNNAIEEPCYQIIVQ